VAQFAGLLSSEQRQEHLSAMVDMLMYNYDGKCACGSDCVRGMGFEVAAPAVVGKEAPCQQLKPVQFTDNKLCRALPVSSWPHLDASAG